MKIEEAEKEETKIKDNDITLADILNKLTNENIVNDTEYSEKIFNIEEGCKDENGNLKSSFSWKDDADNKNDHMYTQKFHLKNYIEDKLNNGYSATEKFNTKCFGRIKNCALRIYIMEIVYDMSPEYLGAYNKIINEYYGNSNRNNRKKPKFIFDK